MVIDAPLDPEYQNLLTRFGWSPPSLDEHAADASETLAGKHSADSAYAS